MTSLIRTICLCSALLLCAAARPAQDDVFPRPPELAPDIGFWVSIFSEYSSNQGVLHDNRHLGVIYEQMPMPARTGRRERQRKINARRKHYQNILRKVASGNRNKLSADEQRVLALWPADVSNETLKNAAGRIRFQQGLSDRFREGLVRSGRWRDHVNAEFTRRGVPVELAALPHVESSYNPDARSHVGASGIWQFTRSTGRRFMQVDHVLDERNDPYAATEAAAELLAYNYSIAGNWPMAITAYNHGLSGVRRAMRQHGDTAYTEILREYRGRTFGFASRNFYVAFLAAMQIDQNPENYFGAVVPDKPVDYARFRLPQYIPAEAVADVTGISQRELARHNPSLQATIWQGSKYLPRDYELRVPADLLDTSLPELMATVSPELRFDKQLPDMYHTIAVGDTLSEIAMEYDTSVRTLVALNGLGSRHRIRAGQRLRLPAAGPAPTAVAAATAPAVEPVTGPPAETVDEAAGPAPEPTVAPPVAAMATAPALPEITADDRVSEGALSADIVGDDAPTGDIAATVLGAVQASLLSDPSDYTVAADQTIEVQPLETLGHYADWLGIRTQRLRDLNGLAFRTPVEVGKRIRLELGTIDAREFETRRLDYHRQQQDTFFRNHTITGVTEHVVARGESVWILSLRRYDVPVWLFRQYNPGLDLHNVQPGVRISFPVLSVNERS